MTRSFSLLERAPQTPLVSPEEVGNNITLAAREIAEIALANNIPEVDGQFDIPGNDGRKIAVSYDEKTDDSTVTVFPAPNTTYQASTTHIGDTVNTAVIETIGGVPTDIGAEGSPDRQSKTHDIYRRFASAALETLYARNGIEFSSKSEVIEPLSALQNTGRPQLSRREGVLAKLGLRRVA